MRFSPSQVAKLFETKPETVKKWAYHFRASLSETANPQKGAQRFYTFDDIRVFACVCSLWEEEPDLENIQYGLDSGAHFENELINQFLLHLRPVFQEPPDDLAERADQGVLYGGLAEIADQFVLANSYKVAGDRLIETALKETETWRLFYPAIYCYRHSMELYLNSFVGGGKSIGHNLNKAFEEFQKNISGDFRANLPQ